MFSTSNRNSTLKSMPKRAIRNVKQAKILRDQEAAKKRKNAEAKEKKKKNKGKSSTD